MVGSRFTVVAKSNVPYLGDFIEKLSADLEQIETNGAPASGNIDAAQLTTGIIEPERLGTGASGTGEKFLADDGTYKAAAVERSVARPEDHGAVGDGVTDDTAALHAARDEAGQGGRVALTGRYAHSGVVTFNVAGQLLDGGGELVATTPSASAVAITADGVEMTDLTLTVEGATERQLAPEQNGLTIGMAPVSGVKVRRVSVTGSAGAGVFLSQVDGFLLEDVSVADTLADGIHMTNGTRNGSVVRPSVSNVHDDGVAVVSYDNEANVCEAITVTEASVSNVRWGRGISVAGGRNVTWRNPHITRTFGAAAYFCTENVQTVGGAKTKSVEGVTCTGLFATDVNFGYDVDGTDLGAVTIREQWNDDVHTVTGVSLVGATITNCLSRSFIINTDRDAADLTVDQVTIAGIAPALYHVPGYATGVRHLPTQVRQHPAQAFTDPNGVVRAAPGSTATLNDGSSWAKVQTSSDGITPEPDSLTGWVRVNPHAATAPTGAAFTEPFAVADGSPWPAERWVTVQAPATGAVSVTGGIGHLTSGSTGGYSRDDQAKVRTVGTYGDLDLAFTFAVPASEHGFIIPLRSTSTDYQMGDALEVFMAPGLLRLRTRLGGNLTTLTDTGKTHTPGVPYRMRVRLFGMQLQVKTWLDSDPEPVGWDMQAATAAMPGAGWVLLVSEGISAAASADMMLDDITLDPSGLAPKVVSDITVRQNADGTWPTITRVDGAHYRWLFTNDATAPTAENGLMAGDELVRSTGTTVAA